MKVGLYFGSFNPIHIGHMAIANYMVEYSSLDQLWFIVSPHNPLKNKKTLLPEYQRLELVNRAIDSDFRFRASNIEFNLPQPSYTIDTLVHLTEKYPKHDFSLIIGSDNLTSFHKWKNYEILLRDYNILVYPRPDFDETTVTNLTNVEIVRAPNMEVSSSFIRKAIAEGRDVCHFMPKEVAAYVDEMNFYK
ncbi:nicotinate-nucleotide adenylyltransferase [Prolixibacteraceae bacterium JC049]|nr:nicotinate-nucleotide adenylyltransferase [Prolixibacteraceae bacterium JC049]